MSKMASQFVRAKNKEISQINEEAARLLPNGSPGALRRPKFQTGSPNGRLNPLSPNSDQDQFSPNNIHTLSTDKL